jgi:hypothetical protein
MWVRDEGPGVDAEERARIFERFARGRHTPRRSDGAGLGLAIADAIARAHHGRIELASRVGAGATFTLVLPDNASAPMRPPDPDSTRGRETTQRLDTEVGATDHDTTRALGGPYEDATSEHIDGTATPDVTMRMRGWPGS